MNYLKIAFRNLRRNKGYAAINVVGLAVGMAACFLIFLFIQDELSYDRFHEKSDRIYRLLGHSTIGNSTATGLIHPSAQASLLSADVSEVERLVRFLPMPGEAHVTRGDQSFYEQQFFYADTSFFDVFTFPLVRGNPETALWKPFSLIITEEVAKKYFGEENPLGKTLHVEGTWKARDYTITGVAENPPPNSHFEFSFISSLETFAQVTPWENPLDSWSPHAYYTYIVLKEGASPEDLQPEFQKLSERRSAPNVTRTFSLQPLTRIHLYSHYDRELKANSDPRYLYIFSGIGLLILIVACINYMNLATARSAKRAQEVGLRKVVGAHRFQIMRQFLGESLILSAAAFLIAVVLARLLLPVFSDVTGRTLAFGFASSWGALAAFAGITLAVGLLAGSYPAFVLSGFQPAAVLRGLLPTGTRHAFFRKGLVVFQFGVSVALITATIICWRQLDYMQTKRLGIDEEHVVVLQAHDALWENYSPSKYLTFKSELLQHAAILSVAALNESLPAPQSAKQTLVPEGFDRDAWLGQERTDINLFSVDPDFLETLGIQLIHGRNLTLDSDNDGEYEPVLINQAMADELGWEDPLGKTFPCCFRPTPQVIGVLEDFHYQTLKDRIEPLVIMDLYNPSYVMVRVQPQSWENILGTIERTWNEVAGDKPFSYSFLDRQFEQLYRAEKRLAAAFGAFSFLAIFIACLGLFGLAAYMAEQRTKEIGIRKVLGASISNIVTLLSKEFVWLVLASLVIAAPVAYYAMSRWLEDFAYRIELDPWLFVGAGVLVLIIAMATVSYQAIKAALTNPADTLRYE